MSRCGVCYGKGYYLVTLDEDWDWIKCDCYLDKGEGNE